MSKNNVKPVKVTIKTPINLPVDNNGRLRPCRECAYAEDGCTWCAKLQKHILPYAYAGPCFATNQELEKKELEKWAKAERKINWLITVMLNMVTGASTILEDIESRMQDFHDELKDRKTIRNDKEWVSKHDRALKEIKKHIEGIRKQYSCFFQPDLDMIFKDKETGKYDVAAYDQNLCDAHELCRLVMLYWDKGFDNIENAQKIFDFICTLQGEGVFEPRDIEHYRIRKL